MDPKKTSVEKRVLNMRKVRCVSCSQYLRCLEAKDQKSGPKKCCLANTTLACAQWHQVTDGTIKFA